ncbi:MAG: FHA domain-containing protein [Anaerolineales bacterium]|nr:FHA domain-containing protein [Anaerolineales bacterium]
MAEENMQDQEKPTDKAYLVINSHVFPLEKITTTIGRKLSNDLVIQDGMVSREHAHIIYTDGSFIILDKNSTGGTFVNNKKVDRCVLYSGDIICLANSHMLFINDASESSEETTGQLFINDLE